MNVGSVCVREKQTFHHPEEAKRYVAFVPSLHGGVVSDVTTVFIDPESQT